jgi:hypothetical protein
VNKSITMITSGGFKVQTVSTEDRGQWFRVTRPTGQDVPLNPWAAELSPRIRTFEQLTEVLKREGEDFTTLTERESG